MQSAIWRYCAENGLGVCNGNRIDDNARCDNAHCQLFRRCDRVALHVEREKSCYFNSLLILLTTTIGCIIVTYAAHHADELRIRTDQLGAATD